MNLENQVTPEISLMTPTEKIAAPVIAEKLEAILEERKTKQDRRETPEARLPASVERRSGTDRRVMN